MDQADFKPLLQSLIGVTDGIGDSRIPDGSRTEWSGQDMSTAPERLVGEAPPLYDTY